MNMKFEFKEKDLSKEVIYEALPWGMFKMTIDEKPTIGYKMGVAAIFFEEDRIVFVNALENRNQRIFLHLPNAKITVEEL